MPQKTPRHRINDGGTSPWSLTILFDCALCRAISHTWHKSTLINHTITDIAELLLQTNVAPRQISLRTIVCGSGAVGWQQGEQTINPRQSSISSKKLIDEDENKKAKESPCKDEAAVIETKIDERAQTSHKVSYAARDYFLMSHTQQWSVWP